METILINSGCRETRAAILVDGVLEDYIVEQEASRGLSGNIYLGKVVRVLPGMQSAFVNIGLERTAYLHVSMVRQEDPAHPKPIEEVLHEGSVIIVQVIKDPVGTKGARLSMLVSLPGRTLVYLPYEDHIGISQRIDDEERREALRERITQLREPTDKGGYIVRTSVSEAPEDYPFDVDMAYLRRQWEHIRETARVSKVPSCLYEELSLGKRLLRDRVTENTQAVWVDNKPAMMALVAFAQTYLPGLEERIRFYKGFATLFEQYGIERDVEHVLQRNVALKSGGYLVIDQTEAMTTIDVNTGAYVGRKDFADTVYQTNLEATEVIARQMRLRNLGGMIIVDFIDMHNDSHKADVLESLRKAVSLDRNMVTVSGFSELGLVEMTRKRTRDSLNHVLCEPCPLCQGRGTIMTVRTVAYAILREVLRENRRQKTVEAFRVRAHALVVHLLEHEEKEALDLLMESIEKRIILEINPDATQESYEISSYSGPLTQ